MLKIEKKIQAELNRLERYLYDRRTPVDGWMMKRGYYKGPKHYEMLDEDWRELLLHEHVGRHDLTVFLKNRILLSKKYQGQRTVLLLKTGGEGCVSEDGRHYNGLDFNRNMILLTDEAAGDETYEIEVEAYCKDLILDSDNAFKTDVVITQSELASVCVPVWDLYFRLKTCFEFISGCDEEYTRQRVLHVIYEALLALDYQEKETLSASASSVLEVYEKNIRPYENLKLPVTLSFAGHSHIDVAWHWPLKETVRKVSRTFSSMLRLMEQYDQFKFCQSMPVLYEMAKQYDPEVYEQIKERVREGRWETLGSMYLEPDCNLISGESFVRQIMYGKRFYRQEFGTDARICFLPDVFGYSSAMPQILKKAGTDYFFTTKLTWNETNEFPYSIFKWKGLDGTEILSGMMSMCTERGLGLYNGDLSAAGVKKSLDYFKNKEQGDPLLYLYGHGDGGGGVTKEMLEALTCLDHVPFTPEIKIGTVTEYFEALDKEKEYPVWSGELYFEKHRGTYTTAANNKKNNRKSEFLFRDAEILSVFHYIQKGSYTGTELEGGWKKILLNQFHDILPGTCIGEVYEECDRQYEEIRNIGMESIHKNLTGMTTPAQHRFTIFNTLSWNRDELVSVSVPEGMAVRTSRQTYPKQIRKEDGTILFLAEEIPALGYETYELTTEPCSSLEPGSEPVCENGQGIIRICDTCLDVKIDGNGELTSVFDKRAGRELLKAGKTGNCLKLQEDIPVEWGAAWETTMKREDKPSYEFEASEVKVTEHNLLRTIVCVHKTVHHSDILQEIIIRHDKPLIEFKTVVDWDEHQKMLRVEFPVDIHTLTARYDAAFGNVEHPNHMTTSFDAARFEVCGHKWGDISDGSYGVALMNDCKYGYSIQNSVMELSLLRSADFPSDTCDKGIHSFSYWIYPHEENIMKGRVAQTAYEVNIPVWVADGAGAEDRWSMVQTDCHNMIIDTVKKAEEDDSIIIRIFETYNTVNDAELSFSFPVSVCEETDLLEEKTGIQEVRENHISFRIRPYEIRTFRLTDG